ncbi:Sorting nexin-6, partial [Ataeniobius toweri]|nr:Sorting nexin-6 [Ataeniobius toweri]
LRCCLISISACLDAADDMNRIASSLYTLGTQDSTELCKFFLKVSELFEKTRKIEARVAADEDLKLADLLKYYLRESQAAKDLLYRRSRGLVDYENANKALDKARAKNRDVLQAETNQQLCCHKFEKISESAKQELIDFKTRRVAAFRKNLVELAELELKHAKGNLQLLQSCVGILKATHACPSGSSSQLSTPALALLAECKPCNTYTVLSF